MNPPCQVTGPGGWLGEQVDLEDVEDSQEHWSDGDGDQRVGR
jgi:hypothetical protein